jgi:hypothetical protein
MTIGLARITVTVSSVTRHIMLAQVPTHCLAPFKVRKNPKVLTKRYISQTDERIIGEIERVVRSLVGRQVFNQRNLQACYQFVVHHVIEERKEGMLGYLVRLVGL